MQSYHTWLMTKVITLLVLYLLFTSEKVVNKVITLLVFYPYSLERLLLSLTSAKVLDLIYTSEKVTTLIDLREGHGYH